MSYNSKTSYKRLGDYIEPCNEKNINNEISDSLLRGISNRKFFQKAKTNTNGVDLSKYRIVRTGQFAFNRATTRNGDKISIGYRCKGDCIVSPSYRIFKSKDENILNSEYLMMWFRRPEFDRYARFKSHGSAHEFFDYDEMCEVELPIPSIEKQRAIVKEYNTVVNRITLNETLNQKLEETAQALYKHWFVDFEFPNEQAKPYKSSGGKMVFNEELDKEIPEGWGLEKLPHFIEVKYGKDYKHLSEGIIPLYGSGGIMKYVNDALYEETSILIPRKGSLQNILLVDEPFWSVDTMFYSKIKEIFYKYYVFYFLCGIDFYALNHGAAVPSTTANLLNNFKIIKPKDDDLKQFNSRVEILFDKINRNNKQSLTLQEVQSLLLAKMTKVKSEKELVE